MIKRCVWVDPVLVTQVKFTEWNDGQLRQPVFLGLRSGEAIRTPKEVVRE
jgi:bifunctional non-homologous end joining protein LigD